MKEHEIRFRIYECQKDGKDGYQCELEGRGVSAELMCAAVNELMDAFIKNFLEEGENK